MKYCSIHIIAVFIALKWSIPWVASCDAITADQVLDILKFDIL